MCPFPECTQHHDADKPKGFDCTKTLIKHLNDQHGHEIVNIPLSYLKESNLHICHQCTPPKIFSNPTQFNKHCNSHITHRTTDNFTILTKHLYDEPTKSTQNNNWQSALKWLSTYDPEPPPFRTSLIPAIKYQLEDMLLDLLSDIIIATNELKKPPEKSKEKHPSYDTDVAAGQLIYIYEQLILAPTTKEKNGPSLTQLIKRRIRLFRSGQLETLYNESRSVTSRVPDTESQPQSQRPPTTTNTNPQHAGKAAQRAANEDDFRTATARLLKSTPIAPNTQENIEICRQLHPDKYPYQPKFPARPQTRSQVVNTNPITFTTEETIQRIRTLPKGKALGIQGDSLDLFIRLVQKRIPHNTDFKQLPKSHIAKALATFFSNIANAKYGKRERNHMNTIYFVAFHKDPTNKRKLRPIGVPSAIRRITANLLINKNKYDFASYLLPYNYAVGVSGGITTIVNTLRLGVDKFISQPQRQGKLPSRALVSLDIKNMFNAVSRHKLREIIAHEFPHLQPITDSLYEDYHTAKFKNSDNKWEHFTVEEGFTQGCPFSPLFAGLVLTHILKNIHKELIERAANRLRTGQPGDDGQGGLPIIMAYVDDTNCLLPIEDVLYFLQRFEHYGIPLGAIMNTDKTRIMTSTSGHSILDELTKENPTESYNLRTAISTYSTNNTQMHEEVNGLRILGSPIGSTTFQQEFIQDYLQKAKTDAANLLKGLEDEQTILQLYRQCTTQRLNHLFPADVYAHAHTTQCNANSWHCWDSPTARAFDDLNQTVILAITQKEAMPIHSQLLININTKHGGIGITSPRLKAIPAYILATKTTLDTIQNGIYLGKHRTRFQLPTSITSLYNNSNSNTAQLFQIYNKFSPEIASICTNEDTTETYTKFISNCPLSKCHNEINSALAKRLRTDILHNLDNDSKHNAEEILDGKLGQGLLDLPRTEEKNRQPNDLFRFNLLRCLRLNIWETTEELTCPLCQQDFDTKGDHLFQCHQIGRKVNTKMHNKWRDTWQSHLNTLMPLLKLTNTKALKEQTGLIRGLHGSKLRPFDTHVNLPPISTDNHYRCKLQSIGFDMVLCNSDTCPPPSRGGTDAKSNNIITSLLTAEKNKFQRGKSTNKASTCSRTGITLSGDQIIGELYNSKKQLIPFAISPLGLFGPTINSFLYGTDPPTTQPHNISEKHFPHAYNMAKRAFSKEVPSNILHRANTIWKQKHPNRFYGHSYKSPDPLTYYTQQFGREVCLANGTAGLEAISLLGDGPKSKSSPNTSCHDDAIFINTNCTDTPAFRRLLDRNTESSQHTVTTSDHTDAHFLDSPAT